MELYYLKNRNWSGVKRLWTIQNKKPVIDSINKLILVKKAKLVLTFDFSTLHTKVTHDQLLSVLNSVIEYAFRGSTRDKIYELNDYK